VIGRPWVATMFTPPARALGSAAATGAGWGSRRRRPPGRRGGGERLLGHTPSGGLQLLGDVSPRRGQVAGIGVAVTWCRGEHVDVTTQRLGQLVAFAGGFRVAGRAGVRRAGGRRAGGRRAGGRRAGGRRAGGRRAGGRRAGGRRAGGRRAGGRRAGSFCAHRDPLKWSCSERASRAQTRRDALEAFVRDHSRSRERYLPAALPGLPLETAPSTWPCTRTCSSPGRPTTRNCGTSRPWSSCAGSRLRSGSSRSSCREPEKRSSFCPACATAPNAVSASTATSSQWPTNSSAEPTTCSSCGDNVRGPRPRAATTPGHLLGDGGTHAWVEVVVPHGHLARAVAFDPCNGGSAGVHHFTVGDGS